MKNMEHEIRELVGDGVQTARRIIMRYVFGIVQNIRNGFTLMGIWII